MTYPRNRSHDLLIAGNRARRRMAYLQRRHRWRVRYRIGLLVAGLLALAWFVWVNMRPAAAQEVAEYVDADRWRGAIVEGFPMLEPTEGAPQTYLPDWQYPTRPRGGEGCQIR